MKSVGPSVPKISSEIDMMAWDKAQVKAKAANFEKNALETAREYRHWVETCWPAMSVFQLVLVRVTNRIDNSISLNQIAYHIILRFGNQEHKFDEEWHDKHIGTLSFVLPTWSEQLSKLKNKTRFEIKKIIADHEQAVIDHQKIFDALLD